MSSTSMGTAVLEAVETLVEDIVFLYQMGPHEAGATLRSAMMTLSRLEELASRRVDNSTLEAHRRRMEVCHIPVQGRALDVA